ncbi:MAG: ABC transporter permease [Anaerolineales bacterium]|jgi:ABC-2 type transport system permease protein
MNFKNIYTHWRTVLIVAEMTLRHIINDSFAIFGILVQPLIIATLALFMLKDTAAGAAMFVVVGSGLTGLWTGLVFESGNSITTERWQGTLETLVGVPTPLEVILFGKNLANVTMSLGAMIASYLLATLLFGYSLSIDQPLLFFASLLVSVFGFISFGLTIAPMFVMYRSVQQFQNTMEYPVFILAGFLFPILLLPNWTTPLSYLLPPYWAAVALHGTSTMNAPFQQILFAWGMLLVFSILDLFIASRLFKVMLYKVRVDATLDVQ